MAEVSSTDDNLNTKNGNFICGVVEGFYGRPWTTEQRKDLFQKMKKWGMDSYIYAPKDDYKHRAYWRELYTVEEAEHLSGLIQAAKDQNITFYYALSPGLDITYSSTKEITALKRKLEQVSQFGCEAFSLLFDDIEPEMCEADKEVYQSFAQAQVSITNEVYQHLGQPKFVVCPTQYCSTRAVPNVTNSEYLNTLGSKLSPEINIMWTGQKVITRTLTAENIQEITEALRRPPVIWDNIHANDYDQKRVFLGPYSGRSPDLIPKLRGVVTNPNCEYGANFIAIHTLAQWSRCNIDGQRDLTLNDTVSADIKLETETEDGQMCEDIPTSLSPNMYHPRQALRNAIKEWLPEFSKHKSAWGPIAKPQPAVTVIPVPIIPSINTCMSLTSTTTTSSTVTSTVNATQLQALAEVTVNDSMVNPLPGPIMNSLVSESKVVCNESIPNPITTVSIPIPVTGIQDETRQITVLSGAIIKPKINNSNEEFINSQDREIRNGEEKAVGEKDVNAKQTMNTDRGANENDSSPSTSEPMDCNCTPNISPSHVIKSTGASNEDIAMSEISTSSGSMQVEMYDTMTDGKLEKKYGELSMDDLTLLCDLFYLPFEHGGQGLVLLQEFNWLKSNANLVMEQYQRANRETPEIQEWFARAAKFNEISEGVNKLVKNLTSCNNRELLYDLYPYVWDIRSVISLLNSYVRWLAGGHFPASMPSYTQGTYTWFSKGWRETFMSGDQEPWVFRGGLTADLQRLMPVDSGNDLFVYKIPDVPTCRIFTIRPYANTDENDVMNICTRTSKDGLEDQHPYPDCLKFLHADRIVAPYLLLHPEFCLVVEDDSGIVGYACAAPDHKKFRVKQELSWIPEMCEKYPLSLINNNISKFAQESIRYFHEFKDEICINSPTHPSSMVCSLLPSVLDQSVSKCLVTALLAALRANGCFGVHATMKATDSYIHTFYGKLGFVENTQAVDGKKIMNRNF
ncbi:protein O-GlcNAcase isoform X1 [Harmonia axyridis]|uniref:protein O-GlcNAcase isoform X1 n=1 Tax=Harmonia axyridis TaxID=115357 RepID=UPI001E278441|nr:protein O-GlcNAcase isoform X1 [Harmonia axyridis]XP_045473463.1 protein O-GlcNAcase isoform X1 [Harmonia axyridis]XP_045473464.1 protein O-GlcNAcase isoform X1 [Harmonia axyridis]